jgi:hypothetical protein
MRASALRGFVFLAVAGSINFRSNAFAKPVLSTASVPHISLSLRLIAF